MYHHHLNLSHENNPLMGHGRSTDVLVVPWCPPFVAQYPIRPLIILHAHPLLSDLASCHPVLSPCVIALSLFGAEVSLAEG